MKDGWETHTVSECITNVRIPEKVPRRAFLEDGRFPVVSQEQGTINGYCDDAKAVFRPGSPVVVFGDHTRALKYIDFDFVVGADGVKILQPKDFLVPKFFYYQLMSFDIEALGYSRHYRLLAERRIAVPPVPDQQRIVAILDAAFQHIATAFVAADRARARASAVFETALRTVIANAYQQGERVPLARLATDITDGDHMPPPKSAEGVPFITIGNVDARTGSIDFSDTFKVPVGYFDRLKSNRRPRRGDVLYTVTGSLGIPVQVGEFGDFCFQRHIALVRPSEQTDSRWLYYLLLSPQVRNQAAAGATGTAQKTVSLGLLRSLNVPVTPLDRQRADAARLDSLRNEVQCLETIYRRKLAALDQLKASLLHEAFSGNL